MNSTRAIQHWRASRSEVHIASTDQGTLPAATKSLFAGQRAAMTHSVPKKILSSLGRSAYRRPITDAEAATLVSFYQKGRVQGGFEAGIQLGIERILADPTFLFRIERHPPQTAPGAAYRLSDLELASRLSFFLWSSIPDGGLLEIASAGRLKDPATLEQQTRRMLADDRSRALTDNFATAWLD